MKNLQKTYQRYKDMNTEEASGKTPGEEMKDSTDGASRRMTSVSDAREGSFMKTQREQTFYQEMFNQLLDIVDAITGQMFERISVLPYTIR